MATGPTFLRPPVAEVICGVQFQDLPNWTTAQFGRFWSTVASEYPETEDHPPLPKLVADAPVQRPDLRIFEFPQLRRVFLKEPSGTHLIQIQADRFLHNWRKTGDDDEYPRFPHIYARFETAWGRFASFLKKHEIEEPILQMWELTYLNHIAEPEATFPGDVWEFLSFYQSNPEAITAQDAKGERLEAANMFLHFDWKLPENTGILSLDVRHGARVPDQRQVLVLELTCRGRIVPLESDLRSRFQAGHDAIVNTFAKLTTAHGHTIWRRTE